METGKKEDWTKWLLIAVTVLTALLNVLNGGKIDGVEKKVEKTIEKSEKVEKEVSDLSAKVAINAANK